MSKITLTLSSRSDLEGLKEMLELCYGKLSIRNGIIRRRVLKQVNKRLSRSKTKVKNNE